MAKTPFIGSARTESLSSTVEVIIHKLRALSKWTGERVLDVGCGDGTFTLRLSNNYDEVYGIDVQEHYLDEFRRKIGGDSKFHVIAMSASQMEFPDKFFSTIVTIETLEHIPDLMLAAREIHRVLAPNGELIITVPNRWFPCENHGMVIGRLKFGRAPFLTYFPSLHRRWALARVFTMGDLDKLFVPLGMVRVAVDYAWPTFEHGGNRLQFLFKPFYGWMRKLEKAPMFLRMFGTSIMVKYVKKDS